MLAGGQMQVYRARNPKESLLWQIANRHYDEFEAAYPEVYQPRYGALRPIIPEVVHKFLECGNLEHGFARVRCDHCEHEYLLAFSCKSRWFCPSCHQKNVQTTARFILDQVVAPVPHRHYVLAIPRMLRPYFQRHRHLLKRLCTLAHESLTEYLRTALGCPEGVPGIIMTLHTFLSQQQDARCPPAGLAAGAGSAPAGRFATTTAQAPVQDMARPDPPRLAC